VDQEARQRFSDFVEARTTALIRLAYVLAGDQHSAEDLPQTALAKTAARWGQLRHADPEAYVRQVMYREQVSRWRQWTRWREVPVGRPPEVELADPSGYTDLRLAMRAALMRLPPAQRIVIVLRYFEDLTETQAAEALGVSVGTIRSRTHRAVDRMRSLIPDLGHAPTATRK
jgi:RNA polymerase sigma-70 factor (sigma-E family)